MSFGGSAESSSAERHPGRRILTALVVMALAAAGVVGVAHWQVHRQQTSDVVWSNDLEVRGDTMTAAGRAYTFNASTGFQVNRLSDGSTVANEGATGNRMLVGRDGHFVVVDRDRLTFFSPDGKQLWDRRLRNGPIADWMVLAVGRGTLTYQECSEQEGSGCTIRTVDDRGSEVAARSLAGDVLPLARYGEVREQRDATIGASSSVSAAPSVPAVELDGRLVQLDASLEPVGESIRADRATVVDDTMIESTRSGQSCLYRGVRRGVVAWTAEERCSEADKISLVVAFHETMYVGYGVAKDSGPMSGRPARMVAIDLDNGSTHAYDHAWTAPGGGTDHVIVGPDVIVEQRRNKVTATSPTSGRRLWSRSFDLDEVSYALQGGERSATVRTVAGAVSAVSDGPDVWYRLALGTRAPEYDARTFDPTTGDTTARVRAPDFPYVHGVDADRTLVVANDRLMMLRTSR